MSKVLPTQQECLAVPEFLENGKPNPEFAEMHVLWALIGIPILGSSPANMIGPVGREMSKHLVKAGFRFHPELQEHKRVRPYRGEQHSLNGAHRWVPMDVDEPEPIVIQDPAAMTVREREAQVERLRYLGYKIDEPEQGPEKAQVVDTFDEPPKFDPAAHSVTEVNAYLRDLDDRIERGRVLHSERNGKARNGILKRNQEA